MPVAPVAPSSWTPGGPFRCGALDHAGSSAAGDRHTAKAPTEIHQIAPAIALNAAALISVGKYSHYEDPEVTGSPDLNSSTSTCRFRILGALYHDHPDAREPAQAPCAMDIDLESGPALTGGSRSATA